jgi:hypothetical protein
MPNTNPRTSLHWLYVSVTQSRYAASKSPGFNWNRISQLAVERTLAGMSVYFYVTIIIDIVPLKIRCLRFMTSYERRGSNSAFFTWPTTSSRTSRTLRCVFSCYSRGSFLSSSYFFYMALAYSISCASMTYLPVMGVGLGASPEAVKASLRRNLLRESPRVSPCAYTLPSAFFLSFTLRFILWPNTASCYFSFTLSNFSKIQSRLNLVVQFSVLTPIPILA